MYKFDIECRNAIRSALIAFTFLACLYFHGSAATTNPALKDTDGDGYLDGPDQWTNYGKEAGLMLRIGEDKNGNGKYEPEGEDGILGTEDDETDPNNPHSYPNVQSIAAIDTDSDGLSYEMEVLYGTDPEDADSDDDGVKDGDEVFIYHTSPNLADTDHDGVPDGFELGLTYSATGDGRNDYNTDWFDHIIKDRVFYFKLPFETQTYYSYAFKPSTIESYRSDPNCCDSDFDQIWDLQELEAESDPMRGLARNAGQNSYTYKALKMLEPPTYIQGWAPVNKQYQIYLNPAANEVGEYHWEAPLTVSLGQSTEAVTLTIETVPASPNAPPYFIFNGATASSVQITTADVKNVLGQFMLAQLTLVCPDSKALTSLNVNVARGTGDTFQYPVGLSQYYLTSDLYEEYFGADE